MTPQQLFLNEHGRLRTGLRLVVFLFVYVALLVVFGMIARVGYLIAVRISPAVSPGPYLQDVIFRGMLLAAALIASFICTRLLDGLPWRAIGLSFHKNWFRDFVIGSLIGVLSLAFATLIATLGGGLRFSLSGRELILQVVQTLVLSGVLFIIAALAEEALLRGYPLQTMTRARLFILGAIITSVAFAALHMDNPNFRLGIPVLNLVIAGIWFAVAYWRTRSLWLPLGIHWAWNWALASVFGLPVSGITDIAPSPLLRGVDLGPTWLTGGGYGVEGGLAGTVALIISTIFVWRTRWLSASAEMLELTSHEKPTSVKAADVPPMDLDTGFQDKL
ncbi:MAG TPA: type II CAAX endopeptidase family protein [Pyrinomonadaceae bacterium]|nr:type II CAAX endopeptidase family protein [Pyrinomonadaceae bacterium]